MSRFAVRILTSVTIGFLASAVLLASLDVGFARPKKIQAGKTYCSCSCKTPDYTGVDLIWEKVASCALNGRDCQAQIGDKLIPGKLQSCQQCTGDISGGFSSCDTAKRLGIFRPADLQMSPHIPRDPKWGRLFPKSTLSVK
jgi:hypothetical protein